MFFALAAAALYFFGLWWCYDVIIRFREDLKVILEVRDFVRTAVIIFIWFLTLIIAIVLVIYGWIGIKETILFVRLFSR